MIGVAVIGAGRIGQIHAANVHGSAHAEILHVADVSTEAAESLAGRYDAKVSDSSTAINDAAVEAVVIASSTDSHAELIGQAARAGKAIFCEKPLDLDATNARQSIDIADRFGVLLCIGFNRRHDPSFEALHRQVESGNIGDVEVVSITSRDPAPPPLEYVRRSGGLFRDMMIHDFDMARWLLCDEPTEVFASASVLIDETIGNAGDVDTALVVLRTANGRMCQITNSRRCSVRVRSTYRGVRLPRTVAGRQSHGHLGKRRKR